MGNNILMPLNQTAISWRPVAPALCLALVLAGRRKHSSQPLPGSPGTLANGSWPARQPG